MTGLHWNHNLHYHPAVLAALPPRMKRVLDVGSGEGTLARELAKRADRVLAVDRDAGMCEVARHRVPDNVTVAEGNALDVTRQDGGFDGITCVASLHHLAHAVGLEAAVKHLRGLLAPGGTLVVLGLHRQPAEPLDYLQYLVARPADLAIGAFRKVARPATWVPGGGPDMPMMDAAETLPQLRAEAAVLLPGATVRRLLFWRYLLVYTEPS
jgi:ubiquinone/menaquinone biosynthesis C-methylase UbiE